MIDVQRLKHVQSLFTEGPSVAMRITLDAVLPFLGLVGSTESPMAQRAEALAKSSNYVLQRLSDVLVRFAFLDWLRRQFVSYDKDDGVWNAFASLAVKDFHSDVASLMDSTAPMIILIDGELKSKDAVNLPGFSDVLVTSKRSYYKELSGDVKSLVDGVSPWWPTVKRVRDSILHRRHYRIIFGRPSNGFHFQVQDHKDRALLNEPILGVATGRDIVDFSIYSVWVISEAIYFLDQLGRVLIQRFDFPDEMIMKGGRTGDAGTFLLSLTELIRRASS